MQSEQHSGDSFFRIPTRSDRERDVVQLFLDTALDTAKRRGKPLHVVLEGVPLLAEIASEKLPDYSQDEAHEFLVRVVTALYNANDLANQDVEGHA